MRRAISDLIDPPLSKKEKQRVWDHFDSRCAYCGCSIERTSRYGHIDHLVSRANGGGNQLGNCVLACKECNGNDKRDQDWEGFLKSKCPDRKSMAARRERILAWQDQPSSRRPLVLNDAAKAAKLRAESVIEEFERALKELRDAIR